MELRTRNYAVQVVKIEKKKHNLEQNKQKGK